MSFLALPKQSAKNGVKGGTRLRRQYELEARTHSVGKNLTDFAFRCGEATEEHVRWKMNDGTAVRITASNYLVGHRCPKQRDSSGKHREPVTGYLIRPGAGFTVMKLDSRVAMGHVIRRGTCVVPNFELDRQGLSQPMILPFIVR